MASSSHAQQPLPYEVFISFRGEDTRNNFVSHLHSALKGKGIRTYFDEDNLQQGQTIGIELVRAIEESRIAIVVLSENYGSSTWCLNELVKIMECKDKSGLIVFPIFYHVDPSVVRKQERKFLEAFAKHEVDFKEEGEKVKSWREALTQVSNLAGEHIVQQNEASCVEKIVDIIFNQLPVKASAFRKSCVGIESHISKIRKLMNSKPQEVLFIGLWGMGGVGKTTLARAIFEDCKQSFEGCCFLENVKEKKSKIHKLQKELLCAVFKKKFDHIRDVVTGTSLIQERLWSKKIILVIDDVDDKQQLNDLANQSDCFCKGSRIIITTRNKHLINEGHIQKFEVHILPEKEALQLFSLHAFKKDHPDEDFKDLSLKILSYAAGLPLALSVLGKHLYLKGKDKWEEALNELKVAPNDKIMKILQISFDGLRVILQEIFLDIACLFRGKSRDYVEDHLKCLGLSPGGIDELCEMSLIYMRHHFIEMHDLLQEMGWYINRHKCVKRSPDDDVRKYRRLWLEDDVVKVLLSRITEPCDVERLYLNAVNLDDSMKPYLGWEVTFRNMSNLRLLVLYKDIFKGNYDDDVNNVTQPFGQFGDQLLWFSWYAYPGKCLPKGFHPVNLVQLHMEYSKITKTPDFTGMPNLEVVNLYCSVILVDVHPSLGIHKKIKHIYLSYCKILEEFPSIDSQSLETLDLSGTNLQNFPEICGNLESMRAINLKRTAVRGLPQSISGIASLLQNLEFDCGLPKIRYLESPTLYKEDFKSLDVVTKSFPGLVSIVMTYSGITSTLDFSLLPYLEKLDLSCSKELVEVHESLGKHKRIKSIELLYCSKLKEFPPIVDMESLEKLVLSGTRLQNFPEMSGNVKRLVELDLSFTHITSLPWSIGCATSLESLRMAYCHYLVQLPDTILGDEILISSNLLKNFIENIDDGVASSRIQWTGQQPSKNSHICFKNCKRLEELPESLLSRVHVLEIEDCSILISWIRSKLVDLLDEYQHLHILRLHPRRMDDDDDFLQAFRAWEIERENYEAKHTKEEPMCNMLRERKEPLEVCGRGIQIPSWFKYRFSNRRSMTMYLPPLSEWYNDKLRGFLLGYLSHGINRRDARRFEPKFCYRKCCFLRELHLFVRYIPICDVSRIIENWNGEDECILFEQTSQIRNEDECALSEETSEIDLNEAIHLRPSMGLSFVYSEGEVNEAHPLQLTFVEDDDASPDVSPVKGDSYRQRNSEVAWWENTPHSADVFTKLFRVKIARR